MRDQRKTYGAQIHQAGVPRFTATLFLTNHLGGNWVWNDEYQQMTANFSAEIANQLKTYLQQASLAATVSTNKGGDCLILPPSTYSMLRKSVEEGSALDLKGKPLKDSKKPLADQIAAELKQQSRAR